MTAATSAGTELCWGNNMDLVDFITRELTDDAWMDDGACKGLTHLFFPTAAERPQTRELREQAAQRVCEGCMVRVQCRDFARDNHEYGFWGGESEHERHAAGFRLIAPIGVRARQSS
ncbi:MAG: WhiB family transcriptional regulator [Ilumatobacteraceae bacterium]